MNAPFVFQRVALSRLAFHAFLGWVVSRIWTAHLALLCLGLTVAPAVAEPISCQDERAATSHERGAWTELRITNDGDDPVSLVWTDTQGKAVPYATIAPHSTWRQASYVGHVWSLRSAKGDCVCAMRLGGRTRWTRGPAGCRETAIAPYEPTAKYDVKNIEGWRVLVSSAFADHVHERDASLAALRRDLAKIRRQILPRSAVALLRKTPIWLEFTDDLLPDRAAYHPYLEYLVASGLNPDKVRSLQFTARSFEVPPQQPAMVLHELAHAFHDQALGYDDPEILAGYFRACGDARLHQVERVEGRPERHYGLNNQTEFFAEFTEATFWRNDYPPKDRAALLKFDPSIAALIKRSWKKRPTANVTLGAPHQVCPAK